VVEVVERRNDLDARDRAERIDEHVVVAAVLAGGLGIASRLHPAMIGELEPARSRRSVSEPGEAHTPGMVCISESSSRTSKTATFTFLPFSSRSPAAPRRSGAPWLPGSCR